MIFKKTVIVCFPVAKRVKEVFLAICQERKEVIYLDSISIYNRIFPVAKFEIAILPNETFFFLAFSRFWLKYKMNECYSFYIHTYCQDFTKLLGHEM